MKKQITFPTLPRSPIAHIDGKQIENGTTIIVDGEPGEFTFRYVWTPDGSLACFGGQGQYREWRNFPVSRCHLPKTKRKWKTERSEEQLVAMRERAMKARMARLAKKGA
jgi:hypothetical protein